MTVKIYQVGGSVRDQIMGRKSNDIDYAVEASSYDEMREFILEQSGSIFLETPQYVTIRAKLKGEACDFTLCRKESGYSDNRHPDIIEPGTILEDLSRRDFTMNAIAIDADTGEYIDPYNGIEDIQNQLIRTVGLPSVRFIEDGLRVLRAIRFSITLGFTLSPLIDSILENQHLLDNISVDRIREELTKMFKHDTIKSLILLNFLNINKRLFNERTNIWLMPTNTKK